MISVRNLRPDEQATLPPELRETGMPYLDPEWVWVIEAVRTPAAASRPFALVVTSFAHGWLVLWRVLAISPLPPEIPLNWFLEALPQVFAAARERGCVFFFSMFGDGPVEAKLARLVQRIGGKLLPFQGSIAVGSLGLVAESPKESIPDFSTISATLLATDQVGTG